MEIALTEERVFILNETLSWEEAKERAWDKKAAVFTTGLGKLFARAKPDEIKIANQQKRWEPFWHVRCHSRYVYERTRHYQVPIPHPEVRTVVIDEREYVPGGTPRGFTMMGLEKCREEETAERFVEAITGEAADLEHFIEFEAQQVTDLEQWQPAESVILPPQTRASTIVREAITSLMKPLDADTVQQDLITIELVDLYYRPVYAFEFHWEAKDRTAVAEFDGLTGKLITEGASIRQVMGKVLTPDVLFDVGIDAIDLLVPGGGIAIKLAKAVQESRK